MSWHWQQTIGVGAPAAAMMAQIVPDADIATKLISTGATGILGLVFMWQQNRFDKILARQAKENRDNLDRIEAAHEARAKEHAKALDRFSGEVRSWLGALSGDIRTSSQHMTNTALECKAEISARRERNGG